VEEIRVQGKKNPPYTPLGDGGQEWVHPCVIWNWPLRQPRGPLGGPGHPPGHGALDGDSKTSCEKTWKETASCGNEPATVKGVSRSPPSRWWGATAHVLLRASISHARRRVDLGSVMGPGIFRKV